MARISLIQFGIIDFVSLPLLRLASKDASILGLPFIGGRCLFILLAILVLLSVMPAQAATGVDPVFGKIDLAFERNQGQVNPQVKFLARTPGYSLFLTENETVMNF